MTPKESHRLAGQGIYIFKILTIPFDRVQKGFDEDVLNKFCLNKEIVTYQAQFFADGTEKYWTVFVEYDPVVGKTPEKETEKLDEPQKILMEKLRVWRKERAGRASCVQTPVRLRPKGRTNNEGPSLSVGCLWAGRRRGRYMMGE